MAEPGPLPARRVIFQSLVPVIGKTPGRDPVLVEGEAACLAAALAMADSQPWPSWRFGD